MEEEPIITSTVLTPAVLSSMKRSELQKLCKKYGLKANGKVGFIYKKIGLIFFKRFFFYKIR